MRIIGEIPHALCRITLYHWNNRYLIKLEKGYLEQTFKIDQFEVTKEEELYKILDETFLKQALERFSDMARSFQDALQRA